MHNLGRQMEEIIKWDDSEDRIMDMTDAKLFSAAENRAGKGGKNAVQ